MMKKLIHKTIFFIMLMSSFSSLSNDGKIKIDIDTFKFDGGKFDRIIVDIDPHRTPKPKDKSIYEHIANEQYALYIIRHVLAWVKSNYSDRGMMEDPEKKELLNTATERSPDPFGYNQRLFAGKDPNIYTGKRSFDFYSIERANYYLTRRTKIILFTSHNNLNSIWSTVVINETNMNDLLSHEFYPSHILKDDSAPSWLKHQAKVISDRLYGEWNLIDLESKQRGLTNYKLNYYSNSRAKNRYSGNSLDFTKAMLDVIIDRDFLSPIYKSSDREPEVTLYLDNFKAMLPIYKAMGFTPWYEHGFYYGLNDESSESITKLRTTAKMFKVAARAFTTEGDIFWQVPEKEYHKLGMHFVEPESRYTPNELRSLKLYMRARSKKKVVDVKKPKAINFQKSFDYDPSKLMTDYRYEPQLNPPPFIVSRKKMECSKLMDIISEHRPLY